MIGIYKITNPEGKIYIGSSKNIKRRWQCHCYHPNKTKISNSIFLYGHKSHCFEIIEICEQNQLLKRERYWQEFYLSYLNGHLNSNKSNNTRYEYGKRQRIKSIRKVYYMDKTNGVFYDNTKEIAELYSLNQTTLLCKLNGTRRNNTCFIRV